MQRLGMIRRMFWSRIRIWAEEEWGGLLEQVRHGLVRLGRAIARIIDPVVFAVGAMGSYHLLNRGIQYLDPTAGTLDLGVLSVLGFVVLATALGARLVLLIWEGWSNQEKGGVSWHDLAYEKGLKTLMWLAYLLWLAWLL